MDARFTAVRAFNFYLATDGCSAATTTAKIIIIIIGIVPVQLVLEGECACLNFYNVNFTPFLSCRDNIKITFTMASKCHAGI